MTDEYLLEDILKTRQSIRKGLENESLTNQVPNYEGRFPGSYSCFHHVSQVCLWEIYLVLLAKKGECKTGIIKILFCIGL